MDRVRRIAVLLGHDTGFYSNVIRGVRAYALQKPDWTFHNGSPDLQSIPYLRGWEPHGIIANLSASAVAQAMVRMRKPLVDTACVLPELGIPVVDVDHVAVGRVAATYFIERRFVNFGFFGSEKVLYSRMRESGFRQQLAEHGRTVSSCYYERLRSLPAKVGWKRLDQEVRAWLDDLPKPVAIFACNDGPVRNLADMCRQLGLHIPNQVALLGVDDNELECPLTFPTLSSVVIPSERIGYEAAKLLDEMISGMPAPATQRFLPPVRIVTRQSTDTMAIDDPKVLAAVACIRQKAVEGIMVKHVVREIGGNRRKLERRFRRILGRSVLEEIQLARVERAKELLLGTDHAMPDVAGQCGFANQQRLAVVFRRFIGMTPTAYRRLSRIHKQPRGGTLL